MSCQNSLQKCPLQKVAPKPKLPSKTPYQNSLILDKEKLNREKLDREKLNKEKLDREKLDREKLDREKLDKEKERRKGGKKEKIKIIFTNCVYIVLKL